MVTFVAVYRGASVQRAQLVAVSTDAELVAHVAGTLLTREPEPAADADAIVETVTGARRRALRLIREEATAEMRPPAGRVRRRSRKGGSLA